MLIKLKQWLHKKRMFVMLDPHDNSVTLSSVLLAEIKKNAKQNVEPKVFVYKLKYNDRHHYAFCLNPDIGQETQLANIQYNQQYNCVGFESLNPAVTRILYDYHLPNVKVKLNVEVKQIAGITNYIILKP